MTPYNHAQRGALARRCFLPILVVLPVLLAPGVSRSQGTMDYVTFRTGTSGPVLQTRTYEFPPLSAQSPIMFEFGFASVEQPGPGSIFDSFSISVQGVPGVSQLVTIDANGAAWAPETSGTISLPNGSLSWQQGQFREPTGGMDVYGAYSFSFAVPDVWAGHALSFHFDMFDNQDSLESLAYGGVTAIPEPSVSGILLVGIATHLVRRFTRKR